MTTFHKDPDAVLDYVWDWSAWLADGDTIATATATPEVGITVDNTSHTDTQVVLWLSGGTARSTVSVTVRIVTSAGRTDERTARFNIAER